MRAGPNRRDRWKAKLATATSVPPACRLFCLHVLAKHMNAQGLVSRPRPRLANEANVSERRVTQFITQAKDGGWLIVVQPGYKGMTAVYQATFPDAQRGNGSFPLSHTQRGNDAGPLYGGTESSRFEAAKGEQCVPTKVGTYVPTAPGLGAETAIFPLHADGSEIDFDDASIKIKTPTTHLRVVNG